jgi:hypothetical protein
VDGTAFAIAERSADVITFAVGCGGGDFLQLEKIKIETANTTN